jgi:site-specific recombinase XerD
VSAPKRGETIPAHLSMDEMNRLLEMPDTSSPLGRRDRAILELFYASGCAERAGGLGIEDLISRAASCACWARRKERLVPFNTGTARCACEV